MSQKQKPKFRLSISMLNAYDHFVYYGEDELSFNVPDLINFINFNKEFRTEKEINLEIMAADFKKKIFSGNFLDIESVRDASKLMPGFGSDNVYCSVEFEDLEIVGIADFCGFGQVVNFSATSYYQSNSCFDSNCNWFLRALKERGIDQIDHIILIPGKGESNEDSVTCETFHLHGYDFSTLEDKARGLRSFIEKNIDSIKNKKVLLNV